MWDDPGSNVELIQRLPFRIHQSWMTMEMPVMSTCSGYALIQCLGNCGTV